METCTNMHGSLLIGYNIVLQFQQLEDLGYHAFAFGFHGDSVQLVGTSTALKCCSPQLLEYLHATIVAGELVYIVEC